MRSTRALVALGWVLSVVLAAGAAFLAARATFVPPQVQTQAQDAVHYTVAEGTVGRSLELPVRATWETVASGRAGAGGTVTSLDVADGDRVDPGATVAEVDLRPMVAMAGATPAFRDLARTSQGRDVRQLEDFLHGAGYLARAPGERFDRATHTAVRAWQADAGYPVDGTVRAGDVVFVPDLPARVVVPDGVAVGARIGPGEVVLGVLGPVPDVRIELSREQASLVPSSGPVTVVAGDTVWEGHLAASGVTEDGAHYLTIEAPDGGPVCGDACGDVPASGGSTMLTGRVVAVEERTGPVVPSAAVRTRPDGSTFVVRADGTEVDVELLGVDGGRAVVSGVRAGDVLRLFGTESSGDGP